MGTANSQTDFRTRRLFVDAAPCSGIRIELDRKQANYLLNVLRLKAGDAILVFNGTNGEWLAHLEPSGRKSASLLIQRQTRLQPKPSDLVYAFCPLKQARLDYMVQKAVEMGAGILQPMISEYTQIRRLNLERIRANSIEAAEQCGILTLAKCNRPLRLDEFIKNWDQSRSLIFCDEAETGKDPKEKLSQLARPADHSGLGVLIGPEGGFSPKERELLRAQSFVTAISLGPRILRADTAAIAALALVQSVLGDWREE